jgi:hypothetical protein
MKRFLSVKFILCLLVLTMASGSMFGQEFSLDDDPTFPLTGPFAPPFRTAEDEFGLNLPATLAGLIGPSPSLAGIFLDSDILLPGPAPFIAIPFSYVDSVSSDHNPNNVPMQFVNPWIAIRFSIDRATGGRNAADASWNQALIMDHPADIFQGSIAFQHPGNWCPSPPPIAPPWGGILPPAGTGGASTNFLISDNTFFRLVPFPDNIDAYNVLPPLNPNNYVYFTLHHAESVISGFSGADLMVMLPGGATQVYAPAPTMGLDVYRGPNSDSIDALIIWENGGDPGLHDPDIDYALFSLAPGSGTLLTLQGMGLPAGPGTVFFTTFNGNIFVYIWSSDVSIGPSPAPPLLGNRWDTNIDALEKW